MLTIPQQPFGFVAGRWVLSMADTPVDADRAPDYKPLDSGTVIFKNKLSHRVVSDGQGGSIGIVKTRYEGKINENGQLVDAEENEFVALPVGVYTVSFSFGQYSWPQFDFELTAEHTLESPFWLPSESPIPSGPGVVHVVSEEARLAAEEARFAAEAAATSAWEAVDTPGRQGIQGIQGLKGDPGDVNLAQLEAAAGVKLVNPMPMTGWTGTLGTISQVDGYIRATVVTPSSSANLTRASMGVVAGRTHYQTFLVKPSVPVSVTQALGAKKGSIKHLPAGVWTRVSDVIVATSSTTSVLTFNTSALSPGETIDVKDVMRLDLTILFGAGREPSLQYMDSLTDRYGYFTGDKIVSGTAYQDLVVSGPGLGLRLDNSVGTRVLLDHPGGTHMLYGDTGWRNVSGILENGWTGTLHVRRENTAVVLRANSLNGSAATSNVVYTLPQGMVDGVWRDIYVYDWVTGKIIVLSFYPNQLKLTVRPESYFASGYTEFLIGRVNPSTLWPTTLPGTPLA